MNVTVDQWNHGDNGIEIYSRENKRESLAA